MKLTDYIKGKRRGKAANRIEREAMDDSFLAEALEGYDAVEGNHTKRLGAMRRELRRRTAARHISQFYWSVAACALVLIGLAGWGAFYMRNNYSQVRLARNAASEAEYAACEAITMDEAPIIEEEEREITSMEPQASVRADARNAPLTKSSREAISKTGRNFHSYTVETIDGTPYPLSRLKGKRVMVVNVASKCGLTPQYAQLQSLYERYGGARFEIVAFPANNFGAQEPGTNAEIKQFCTANYGVTFPVMSKISVKGDDMAPVYQYLTRKALNGKQEAEVTWNFQKFLIDESGNWVAMFPPKTLPDAPEIVAWITTGVIP